MGSPGRTFWFRKRKSEGLLNVNNFYTCVLIYFLFLLYIVHRSGFQDYVLTMNRYD